MRGLLMAAFVLVAQTATAQHIGFVVGATAPTKAETGDFWSDTTASALKRYTGVTWDVFGGGAAWGAITGTLSAQTDLQTALDGKLATAANAVSATKLLTARAINGVAFDGTAAITVTAAGSTLSDSVPFNRGGISGCVATPATTGVQTVTMTSRCHTITPTGATTLNASGGTAGQIAVFSITTAGTTSFVITFGTNFRKTGTLATGTVTARFFTVTFLCLDGTVWTEIARTIVQT